MKIRVFKNVTDIGPSYSGWLHWSGNILGFNRSIRGRLSHHSDDINWAEAYNNYFKRNMITIRCSPDDKVKTLLEKIENASKSRGELCFPISGIQPLSLELSLQELVVDDNDILIYSRYAPSGRLYSLAPGFDASEIFKNIFLSSEEIDKTEQQSSEFCYTLMRMIN